MNNLYRAITLGLLSLTVLVAGCNQPDAQMSFNGDMNTTQDGFRMDGKIIDSAGPTQTFENVTIYFYTSDGELIKERNLGTYSGSSEQFMMTSDEIPHYIIIDSPTFWELNTVDVDYYERSESYSRYTVRTIRSRDEFPVDVPER